MLKTNTFFLFLILSLSLFLSPHKSYGNFAEFFAPSTLTSSLAGQAGPYETAANNYYAPALITKTSKMALSLSTFHVRHSFKKISNVQIRNPQNSTHGRQNEYGPIPTEYDNLNYSALHLIIPIKHPRVSRLGLSVLTPNSGLLDYQSGDPFLTEYVMYRSRNRRALFHANLAGPFSPAQKLKNLSWSLGIHLGNKIQARSFNAIVLGDGGGVNGTGDEHNHSYARMGTKTNYTIAGIASLAWHDEWSSLALTFQQGIKNDFSFHIEGSNSDLPLPFDYTMNSLAYYDPHILRLSYLGRQGKVGLYGTVEYQLWKSGGSYRTPVIRLDQNPDGNVKNSLDFESISPRNIFVPKLGLSLKHDEHNTTFLGLAYRPTPLKGDFSGPGNSVDVDKIIMAAGHQLQLRLLNRDVNLHFSVQYHNLDELRVLKTQGTREDGSSGEKIGYPGHTIGGHVLSTSTGLSIAL